MKSKVWKVAIPALAIVLFAAWYWFRPKRLVLNRTVNEQFSTASGDSQALESGIFHSVLHPTKGTATVYPVANGGRILRFTNFTTSNGPDVHVYMVAEEDANDSASIPHAGFIDLGIIKGNIGDQIYTLGPDVDLSIYRTVSVWCKRFSVNFGAAPLSAAHTLSQK